MKALSLALLLVALGCSHRQTSLDPIPAKAQESGLCSNIARWHGFNCSHLKTHSPEQGDCMYYTAAEQDLSEVCNK